MSLLSHFKHYCESKTQFMSIIHVFDDQWLNNVKYDTRGHLTLTALERCYFIATAVSAQFMFFIIIKQRKTIN